MKICRICKLEYADSVDVCAKCGSPLEREGMKWVSPRDYEEEY